MDRDSAERLRDRWSDRLGARVFDAPLGESPEEATGEPAEPLSRVALGVTGSGENWRLAVRIQRGNPRVEEVMAAIHDEAEGEVDVLQIGRVVALSGSPKQKARPVVTGISCSHEQGEPGTIACFVKNLGDEMSPRFVLSNNHVLGLSNLAVPTDVVLQPAFFDLPAGDNAIGHFERLVTLVAVHNLVDAAIAQVDVQCLVRAVFGRPTPIKGIRKTPLQTGDKVIKVGRTTGETHGTVFALGVKDLEVDFEGTSRFFDQQIEITPADEDPFCDRGDSGSLILDEDSFAVGLLFGKSDGADRLAYANPISKVLELLQVDLA
jgi:hypothetical protein